MNTITEVLIYIDAEVASQEDRLRAAQMQDRRLDQVEANGKIIALLSFKKEILRAPVAAI